MAGLLLFLLLWLALPVAARRVEVHAASGSSAQWTTMNANANHTNYVPQSQIGASNVQDLQLAWTFPFPAVTSVPGLSVTGQGAISPPLVVNGTVYLVTNFLTVYAIDGETGGVLWTYAGGAQRRRGSHWGRWTATCTGSTTTAGTSG